MEELKLRLPATFGNVVKSHKHQVKDVDMTATNDPSCVTVLFHWATLVFLCKAVSTQYCMNPRWAHTAMKRPTDLATFFASFARVMGPGGLRKSLVGI
jgi:hypothetical protein